MLNSSSIVALAGNVSALCAVPQIKTASIAHSACCVKLNKGVYVIVDTKGEYRVLADIMDRGPRSIGTIPKGTVIVITQVDKDHRKVIGNEFFDWVYWDLPVEKI